MTTCTKYSGQREINSREHFLRQKFLHFIMDYLPDEFWNIPDELYKYQSVFPPITSLTLGDAYETFMVLDPTMNTEESHFPPMLTSVFGKKCR